ncbi:hypothetical protein GGR56DRAFT_306883 [Xylariaceae sp. FL0804]|nr:hypothetical protein GGR56DRAFT_306883 [Xylariaceae sp. FL0804]
MLCGLPAPGGLLVGWLVCWFGWSGSWETGCYPRPTSNLPYGPIDSPPFSISLLPSSAPGSPPLSFSPLCPSVPSVTGHKGAPYGRLEAKLPDQISGSTLPQKRAFRAATIQYYWKCHAQVQLRATRRGGGGGGGTACLYVVGDIDHISAESLRWL